MGRSIGVVLDSFDNMFSWLSSCKVDYTYSSCMTSTTMSDGDLTGPVSASSGMTLLRKGQSMKWSSFPQVSVERPDQMSNTGRSWCVSSEGCLASGWVQSIWRSGLFWGGCKSCVRRSFWCCSDRSYWVGHLSECSVYRLVQDSTFHAHPSQGYPWL